MMDNEERKLFVPKTFLNVFTNSSEVTGYIAGFRNGEEIICLCASLCREYFLLGLEILGIFCLVDSEVENADVCKEKLSLLQVELENPVVLFVYKEVDTFVLKGKLFTPYSGIFSDIKTTFLVKNPAILLRATGQLPLLVEFNADPDGFEENLELAFGKLESMIQSLALLLKNNQLILSRTSSKSWHHNSEETVKKIRRSFGKKVALDSAILLEATGDSAVNHSLVIHSQRKDYQCVSLKLPLDILVVVSNESVSSNEIYNLVLQALEKQLQDMLVCLRQHNKKSEFVFPVPHHFYPDTWELPLTIIYPSNATDQELESYRRSLHKTLLLPMDRPILRKLNRWEFSDSDNYLINPHEALGPSGVVGGKSAVVYGRYAYHHYMQDRVDDNGWGCAYRSLQTIVSWYKFQGYTDRNVPTHMEIQQVLVEMGDKPKSFLRSKQWIGSQEVSYCLDQLIKVECKIMFVSSGGEMANKGRELLLHFQEQGTPVMIGGGVLAHTILGVDFNECTGDLKFLILDPHYTGGEDLNIVTNKGWCGWKGIKFWDENAFYNLCLPQRPIHI